MILGGCLTVILLSALTACIAAAPATWLLMLFLGNLHMHLSLLDCLPGGLLVGVLRSSMEARR